MPTDRLTRVNELLKREISTVLYREMSGTNFRFEAVTVTRVEIASNLRRARVYVSIRGSEAEAERVLAALRHHRAHLQKFIRRDVILKYTPVLQFLRDESIEKGDRVLDLLYHLPETHDDASTPPAPAPESDSRAT